MLLHYEDLSRVSFRIQCRLKRILVYERLLSKPKKFNFSTIEQAGKKEIGLIDEY